MAFVKSNKIKVFPAAGRSSDYPEGYLTTEDNLNRVIKALYKNYGSNNDSSFVINETVTTPFSFIIQGYYFEIEELPEDLDFTGNLYAAIYLRNTLPANDYGRLTSINESTEGSLDFNTEFKGLQINRSNSFSPLAGATIYKLTLLKNGVIPETSKLKYKTSQIFDGTTSNLIKDVFTTTSLTATTANITNANITTATVSFATVSAANINTLSTDVGIFGSATVSALRGHTLTTDVGDISVSNLVTAVDLTLSEVSGTLEITFTKTQGKD